MQYKDFKEGVSIFEDLREGQCLSDTVYRAFLNISSFKVSFRHVLVRLKQFIKVISNSDPIVQKAN